MHKTPIEFYFDFSSPYGYLASTQIDAVADRHNREIIWNPYLMGAAFKLTGRAPLVTQPMVAEYAIHDLQRSARLLKIPFNIPDKFPVTTVSACRAYYWLVDRDQALAKKFAHKVYRSYFINNHDISKRSVIVKLAVSIGIDGEKLETGLNHQIVKQRLRDETDDALNKQVFGSPYFIVDNEPFWGHDRIAQLETWLERQGW